MNFRNKILAIFLSCCFYITASCSSNEVIVMPDQDKKNHNSVVTISDVSRDSKEKISFPVMVENKEIFTNPLFGLYISEVIVDGQRLEKEFDLSSIYFMDNSTMVQNGIHEYKVGLFDSFVIRFFEGNGDSNSNKRRLVYKLPTQSKNIFITYKLIYPDESQSDTVYRLEINVKDE